MANLEQQLHEDRALRDTAKAMISADIALIKGDADPRPAALSFKDNVHNTALNLVDDTRDFSRNHKAGIGAVVATLIVALLAYLFRDRIAEAIAGYSAAHTEPDGLSDGSEDE